ncbi:MAG TPA: aspartate dehydrogenase, partial [Rhodospirillaceae bacterium]|nr:aspartate dehydrogenase [Rhodospirillaceae bacterium]
PIVDFATLAEKSDLIIECLPAKAVPALAAEVFIRSRDHIIISSASLLIYPEILEGHKKSSSRIIVPSGALAGLDGVRSLIHSGIKSATIKSTKLPTGYNGAPYVLEQRIDLFCVTEKTLLFKGNAIEAAQGFPANVNVAATLSLAGIGPERTEVEIWADPEARGNSHEIIVVGNHSTIRAFVDNLPDPANPKTSILAAQSIVSALEKMSAPLIIL